LEQVLVRSYWPKTRARLNWPRSGWIARPVRRGTTALAQKRFGLPLSR